MDHLLQKIIRNNFADLQGAILDASVPISQALLNEVLAEALQGNQTIASIRASIHPQNRVSVDVRTTLLPWPLNLKLKLDTAVDFSSYGSPKLRVWLENNRLFGSLGSLLNAFPPGIKLYGDQIVLDLEAYLRTPQQKSLLSLVKSVGIRTGEGSLILDVRIEVDGQAGR